MRYLLSEIARAASGRLVGRDREVESIVTDSRNSLGSGEKVVYAAMRGMNHDGHDFIDDMYRRGVRSFMVERNVDVARYPDAGFVVVERTLRGLQHLAADYRKRFKGVVVAVTGSTGKSTVKEWIAQAAGTKMKLFRSPRSYNSQLGAALSLLMIEGDEDVAIIEAGISKPDEMDLLSEMITPDIAVLTELSGEHDENFVSRSAKADQKARLCRGCKTVVYNSNSNEYVEPVRRYAPPQAKIVDAALYHSMCSRFAQADRNNALLAMLVLIELGMEQSVVEKAVETIHPIDMQLSISQGLGGAVVVADNDNSDINSLTIALDRLAAVAGDRRRIVILSDMLFANLPDYALYGRIAAQLKDSSVDVLYGIGRNIEKAASLFDCQTRFWPTVDEFVADFRQTMIDRSAVLVKGNRQMRFERIVHLLQLSSHTTVLEVNLTAMVGNLNFYRSRLHKGCRLMTMVKASAYGHGDYEVASVLQREGVDYLAVAFADEGVLLRNKGITMPIVVLNADEESFDIMVAHRLEPEIYNLRSLNRFAEAVSMAGATRYPIHLKIDSGMHRLGFRHEELTELNSRLSSLSQLLTVRSVFSHLATSDMDDMRSFTLAQISYFDKACQTIFSRLPYKPLRHIDNSAAIVRFPDSQYEMCRLGLGLYGFGEEGLRPVSRLSTRIVQIKHIAKGEAVGYGRQGVLDRDTVLATIPIGYADGLNRHLGNGQWSMRVAGKAAPIVGRVCMDSCMIDITGIEGVEEGDRVVVFGGGEGNGVDDMARVLDTIPYEVMTSVGKRVKRIYTQE